MLRALANGFLCLLLVAGLGACSTATNSLSIGPNFQTLSVYVTNSTQNAISIFAPNPASGAAPVNQIGGNNTQLSGPQYDTFDSAKKLYVSNYNAGSGTGEITVYASQATGNVIPVLQIAGALTGLAQVRGIAVDSSQNMYVANVTPSPSLQSEIEAFGANSSGNISPAAVFAGSSTGLKSPVGLAFDSAQNLWVANAGNATVEAFATKNAVPGNVAPTYLISGPLTQLVTPSGLAVDAKDNIYVCDSGASAILVFAKGSNGNVAPSAVIGGSNTTLNQPVDVKLDASGNIYVTNAGSGKVTVFAPNANGNVAPTSSFSAPGQLIGIALSP